jgi:hypothetical protein
MSCPGLHCPGCGNGGLPVALIAGAAGIGLVTWFILANLVFIALGLAATAVIVPGAVLFLKRFAVPDWNTSRRAALPRTVTAEAIPAPARAAIAPVHQHLHFHGVTPDDIAVIIGQQARPAIRERTG